MPSTPTRDTDAGPDPLKSQELEIKAAELQLRRREVDNAQARWWRRPPDALVLAVLAGALTLLANILVEKQKANDDLALETRKSQFNLVLQAMQTNNPDVANRNIHFFIDAGLLADEDCRIREAIDRDQPVLPAASPLAPSLGGTGQTIGILELQGSITASDLTEYFKSLNLPPPDVTTIPVDGGSNKEESPADAQVMMGIETIGSLAPKARFRIYSAPNTTAGYVDAVKRAAADHVSVLATNWGQPESSWKSQEIASLNDALETAALQGITVIAAAGDLGVIAGVGDGHKHVDFPGSSPWVLSVGCTTLKADAAGNKSETVWKDPGGQFATGGGVSEKFPRPEWQSTVQVPLRGDGNTGRGLPDVVASADYVPIRVHGRRSM